MKKKSTLSIVLLTVLAATLLMASTVLAKNSKYTFHDVTIDEQTVEIEASVKNTKKNDYSKCSYYADDYAEFLGAYDEDVSAGDTAEEVLDFCVEHFDDKN